MKKLLTLLVLLASLFCRAQNYQCLQANVKHYFVDGNYYLRGIRIDSVKTFADSVIYYPFHTPRGRYATNPNLDSTGGSWLGKKVLMLNDGTFLFDNIWNDTIVIKTQANVGDSWVFYNDTTNLYYRADVIGIDTMTVLGTLDSIKTIMITARDPSGIVTTDLVDSFTIILSKNHGFEEVFDLYTFPYRDPDSFYVTGIDYYLDRHMYFPGWIYPTKKNSLFSLTQLPIITYAQLYQWNPTDVYEYALCTRSFSHSDNYCDPVERYNLDTVTSYTTPPGHTVYNFSGIISTIAHPIFIPAPSGSGGIYAAHATTGMLTFDSTLLIDTVLMPEEFKQPYIFSYTPNDTSFCINSTLFSLEYIEINGARYSGFFEGYYDPFLYKAPLGLLSSAEIGLDATSGWDIISNELIYFNRGGISCGSSVTPPTRVNDPATIRRISLSPNPATSQLTIKTNLNQSYTITLINVMGQTMQEIKSVAPEQTIDVSNYPAGVYNISVIGEDGSKWNDKVVIMH